MARRKQLAAKPGRGKKDPNKNLPVGVVEREIKDDNGKVTGTRWYVRVRYREGGKRHAAWRECAKNATAAKEARKKLEQELEQHGTQSLQNNRRDFEALAKHYEDNYLVPALYVDGRKAGGRRNVKNPKLQLKQLRSLVGDKTRLRDIDYEFLRKLRLVMLREPVVIERWVPAEVISRGKRIIKKRGQKVKFERPRSMTDVNRKLELLRHMLKVARSGLHWIHHDPFADALEPLITRSDEKKRRRVMSFDEEESILVHCVEPRSHLRLVVIGLVDSLMRGTEFFKLRVGDLDFDPRKVTVQQMNTKTLCERAAPMSARFSRELKAWFETHDLGSDDRVFPFTGVRKAWATAKRLAGVSDLRLKDLRRTGATRLYRAGHPIAEISQLLGHTSVEMTYVYIGVDRDTTSRAVELLDAIHRERETAELVH